MSAFEHSQVAGSLTVQANLLLAQVRYEEARAVINTGPEAYRRTDDIAVIPATLLGP